MTMIDDQDNNNNNNNNETYSRKIQRSESLLNTKYGADKYMHITLDTAKESTFTHYVASRRQPFLR